MSKKLKIALLLVLAIAFGVATDMLFEAWFPGSVHNRLNRIGSVPALVFAFFLGTRRRAQAAGIAVLASLLTFGLAWFCLRAFHRPHDLNVVALNVVAYTVIGLLVGLWVGNLDVAEARLPEQKG